VCVNGKGTAIVISAAINGAIVLFDIELPFQKYIGHSFMVSLNIAEYYQKVFLS
jgi:hypothetical protein